MCCRCRGPASLALFFSLSLSSPFSFLSYRLINPDTFSPQILCFLCSHFPFSAVLCSRLNFPPFSLSLSRSSSLSLSHSLYSAVLGSRRRADIILSGSTIVSFYLLFSFHFCIQWSFALHHLDEQRKMRSFLCLSLSVLSGMRRTAAPEARSDTAASSVSSLPSLSACVWFLREPTWHDSICMCCTVLVVPSSLFYIWLKTLVRTCKSLFHSNPFRWTERQVLV